MSQVAGHRQDKFAERRAQLAESALRTLSELGYARTTLREIAQNSEFSHGVLHYYFRDKVDLITHCVRHYRDACVTRYDEVVATASTSAELRARFCVGMAETLRRDAGMHRLWYDLRNQSMFEESFRDEVREIDQSLERMLWRIVRRYAALCGSVSPAPQVSSRLAYALLDGVFQHALLRHLADDPSAAAELPDQVGSVIDGLTGRVTA